MLDNEIWVNLIIKGFEHYQVSNKGRIRNTKNKFIGFGHKVNKFSNLSYIQLSNKDKIKRIGVHKLVAMHFGKMTKYQKTAYHINYIQNDNEDKNLQGSSLGQAISRTKRKRNCEKAKLRGIHSWNGLKNKWRAVLSTGNGKMKTIGYFITKKEAIQQYHIAYTKLFKQEPFDMRDYV